MAVGAIVGILGSIIAIEGLMAILEAVVGDPEADVQQALADLASKNQRRAFALEAGQVLGAEEVQRKLSRFNVIPQRALTQAAMLESTALSTRAGIPQDTELLDFVSSRIGQSPEVLRSASAPRRVGDLSGVLRSVGKPPAPM